MKKGGSDKRAKFVKKTVLIECIHTHVLIMYSKTHKNRVYSSIVNISKTFAEADGFHG